jgi:hypothetical protein
MLLRNSNRIIIKVKADKPQRKNEEDRPVVPAGMTFNRVHNVKVSESKHLISESQTGLGTKTSR